MGKATIVDGGPEGNYTIEIDYGGNVRDEKIAKLTKFLEETQVKIDKIQGEVDKAQKEEDDQQALVKTYLDSYVAVANAAASSGIRADPDAFNFELSKLLKMRASGDIVRLKLQRLKDDKTQAQKDRAFWQNLEITERRQAWCVDLTEDASGEVDTIDVPGESALVLIAGGGLAPQDGNGRLTAREVQSPEQVFFNAAILPGWQKFKPTYRTGVITALYSDDTADVKLDDAKSSAQNLDINQKSTLLSVPVTYMDCNAAAFEVDDKCVIRFDAQNWDAPRVVGFFDHPKPCNWPCVFASPDWYAYTFQNTLAEKNPVSMQELLGLSIGVQVRVNRGPWVNLEFIQTISASGGRYYNQWREPGAPGTPRAQLYVGRNFYLSQTNDLSAPAVDGITLYPRGFSGVAAQADIPMVDEFRVSIGGKVKFAAAIYSNNGSDYYSPSSGKVRAPGGIKLSSDSMPVTALNYQLGDTEP